MLLLQILEEGTHYEQNDFKKYKECRWKENGVQNFGLPGFYNKSFYI